MEKQTKHISEDDKFKIHVDKKTLEDPNKTKELVRLGKRNPNIEFDLEHPAISKTSSSMISSSMMKEQPEAVIKPQDQATLKYLSNVVDNKTGEISQPFTIGDKKYQMVRGITPDKNVMLGVYCFDDVDDNGENIIHPSDYFEKTIALPMKEMLEKESMYSEKSSDSETTLGLSEYKHYIVNEKTGKFRKFKTIEELAKANMMDEERYMNIKEFKKYFEGKVFGSKKQVMFEVTPTGGENDEEMNAKAKKLMQIIQKRIPSNIIDTIKTPVAQREVIAAFAEMIGVPRNGLSKLISGLKDIAIGQGKQPEPTQPQQGLTENKKIIKVKDIQ